MSPGRRREMLDREHPSLPIVRQCTLLGVSRSSLYYRAKGASEADLSLMREMDRQYLETPFYGSRRMRAWLDRQGIPVSRKRVQRLMRVMGLRAIYRRPRTSQPAPEHRIYPYLLRNTQMTRTNKYGRRTSSTRPWPGNSSTWWPSWTGTAATWWPGDCPTPWRLALAPMP